jgi:LPXTG-motif cell wall-anchored protein
VTVTGGNVTAAFGQDITCTFTNQDVPPTPTPTPTPTPSVSPPPLPITGATFTPVAAAGVVTFLIGLALFIVARRRRKTLDSD